MRLHEISITNLVREHTFFGNAYYLLPPPLHSDFSPLSKMSITEEGLQDLEDFSNTGIESPTPASGNHDQLPSVEDVKMELGLTSSRSSNKLCLIIFGVLAFAGVFISIIVAAKDSPSKTLSSTPYSPLDVESALREIAINGEKDFLDKDSYQSKAAWNLESDAMVHQEYNLERLKQRYGMYCLYHATNEDRTWKVNNGWKRMGKDECKWYGAMCDDDGMVTRIELRNNGLEGRIPEEVSFISKLEVFNVNANDLSGHVPSSVCDISGEHELNIKVDCASVSCNCCSNC